MGVGAGTLGPVTVTDVITDVPREKTEPPTVIEMSIVESAVWVTSLKSSFVGYQARSLFEASSAATL